jgi:hypothetical protein
MSETTITGHNWVAFGAAGAMGTIRRTDEGFEARVLRTDEIRGVYPTLDVAKHSLQSALQSHGEPLEFREH